VALIREEIEAGGPVTFARFMDRALYEPDLGFYASSTERPTPRGDFVTAPELHPVFGWTLARQIDEMWRALDRPGAFLLREYGAGSGALVLALLEGLRHLRSELARAIVYDPVDLPAQRALIADRLAAAGFGNLIGERPYPSSDPRTAGKAPMTGVVVANEFLDALPVHRVVQRQGELREIYVDWKNGAFIEVVGEPSTDDLKAWFLEAGVTLAEGQQAEVNLGIAEWIDLVDAELERGYVIVIDYGDDSPRLYSAATRPSGTIRAFAGQHVSGDVLSGVGRRDITAHVDFGALERSARATGLDVLGRRKLSEFLIAAGLDDAYATARVQADDDWDSALMLRAAVRRLLDSAALGGYLVSILGKSVAPSHELSGLAPLPGRTNAR
jgi:SAM-dependent MidA family methyltransferase